MKKAFTMAEVLITLGIIAVVAAMTLPALIQKYNIQVTEVRLKKFYSIFNQAILQSTLKNGPYEGWNYWNNDITQEDGTTIHRQEANHKSFNLYIAPFLKVYSTKKLKYTAGTYAGDEYYMYYLSDGSAFRYSRHENREIFFYPRNPEKCLKMEEQGQSVYGTCVFAFTFYWILQLYKPFLMNLVVALLLCVATFGLKRFVDRFIKYNFISSFITIVIFLGIFILPLTLVINSTINDITKINVNQLSKFINAYKSASSRLIKKKSSQRLKTSYGKKCFGVSRFA